jgi:hypothetical protein
MAAVCMDLGHLTLKRGAHQFDVGSDNIALKVNLSCVTCPTLPFVVNKGIDDARELSYTQFKLKLEDIQLIYADGRQSMRVSFARRANSCRCVSSRCRRKLGAGTSREEHTFAFDQANGTRDGRRQMHLQ